MESNELLNKAREITVFLIGFVISLVACISLCIVLASVVDKHNDEIEIYYNEFERQEVVIDSLSKTVDSLQIVNDSLTGKLILATYKIEQIKYYNEIAAKNNNIKYLRGWINRTLNE